MADKLVYSRIRFVGYQSWKLFLECCEPSVEGLIVYLLVDINFVRRLPLCAVLRLCCFRPVPLTPEMRTQHPHFCGELELCIGWRQIPETSSLGRLPTSSNIFSKIKDQWLSLSGLDIRRVDGFGMSRPERLNPSLILNLPKNGWEKLHVSQQLEKPSE